MLPKNKLETPIGYIWVCVCVKSCMTITGIIVWITYTGCVILKNVFHTQDTV